MKLIKIEEPKDKAINKAFNFYNNGPKDGNNDIGVQRSEKFYLRLIDTLIKMINKYEPWIAKQYKKGGGLKRENIAGYSFIGRFLDDGQPGTETSYHWWCIQGNICPNCYREYGQMYYALHCKCKKRKK